MNKKFYIPIVTFTFCFCFASETLAQFTLSAEVRPRAEFRDGFKKPLAQETDAAFFVEQRTRLNTAFSSEKFDIYISFQDVRNWGSTPSIYKTDPTLQNIYAAWAAYKINPKNSFILGRMELDYDNARILGNLDWAAQGRSHDLLKYELKSESIKLHVGAAFNQDYNTPEPAKLAGTYYGIMNSYKTMQYAWLHKDWPGSALSVLLLNNGASATKTLNNITYADSTIHFSQTFGFYGTKKVGDVALEYDSYYQFGKDPGGNDMSAYLVGFNATFFKSKPHNVAVGFDYLSGDKSTTADKDENFNPLYGTHHKFYGWMDYFYVGNAHKNKGLIDGFVKAKFKTGAKSSLLVQGHEFFTQSKLVKNDDTKLSSQLGAEVDIVYVANLAPGVVLNVGYSQMFFTESMEFIKDVTNPKSSASWAWAMISFKPTLFTTKTEEK